MYLELTTDHLPLDQLKEIWRRVVKIAFDFLKHKYQDIVKIVCKRLRDHQCFEPAGEFYEDIGYYEEATKCFLHVNQFEKAKTCLENIKDEDAERQLRLYFDEKYNGYLKSRGEAEKLVGNQEI